MLSSKLRSFNFSVPSADVQSPSNRSCTFRVGPNVIGMSYWHAVRANEARRMHRPRVCSQPNFAEVTNSWSLWQPAFIEIDKVRNALNVVAIGDSHLLFSFFES